MNVAGATDDLAPDEELLTDDDLAADKSIETTMKGPIYPEGVVRVTVGSLRRLLLRYAR